MSTPILKQNLTKGQRVFYFSPIRVSNGNKYGERKVPLTKVIELEYSHISCNDAFIFFIVRDGEIEHGILPLLFYGGIKGLFFHSEEEAISERDKQYLAANLKIESNLREYLSEIQKRLEDISNSNLHLAIKLYS